MKLAMSTTLGLCAVMGLLVGTASAELSEVPKQPTFYKDVLPILQENCQACHRPAGLNMGGMIAPMSLMNYRDVRPWAKAVAKETTAKNMPPWHATEQFHGVFSNERTLTEVEIATIAKWASTGARAGNPADGPAPLEFPDQEWTFGEPDLIVEMPEPYLIKDDVEDEYAEFEVTITEEMLPEPRWVAAAEIRGGSEAVHHIIARPFGGIAPGLGPITMRDGMGTLLKPGQVVTFDMHYHKEAGPGTAVWDQSIIGVKFHTDPVTHPLSTTPIGNTAFEIPPQQNNWKVGASRIFETDTLLVSMMPHMHLRGKDATYTAYYPNGKTEVLLDVPAYDFNWQTAYRFAEPKLLPKGTRVDVTMHFDNSPENESVPNPDRAVRFGGPTTDEMMLGWITFTEKEPKEDPYHKPAAVEGD